jgi:hypothetical protein
MNDRAVLFLRVPPMAAERADEYERWYDEIHIPYRMRLPGFAGAQRWDCVSGHPRYFVFYEMDSIDAMSSSDYLDLRKWEASQPADSFEGPGSSRPGFQRGVYVQRGGTPWPDCARGSSAVLIEGFTPSTENPALFVGWLDETHVPSAAEAPGVAAVRCFELTERDLGPNSGMRTARPELLVAYYLTDVAAFSEGPLNQLVADARFREQSPHEAYELLGSLVFTSGAETSRSYQTAPMRLPQSRAILARDDRKDDNAIRS